MLKNRTIIGINTCDAQMLRVCVPAVHRVGRGTILVVHNANTAMPVTRKFIRRLGWHGKLILINAKNTMSKIVARLELFDYVSRMRCARDAWFIPISDNDIIRSVTPPRVADNVFAILQNRILITGPITNILRAIAGDTDFEPDGHDIALIHPNAHVSGVLMRARTLYGFADAVRGVLAAIGENAPADAVLWSYLNIYARHNNKDAQAIYMNNINLATVGAQAAQQTTATDKFDAVFAAALRGDK